MELQSFKSLLLKKAGDDPTLQMLINVMKDELIAQKVIESLEKMARPQASMGRGANAAVTAYGRQIKKKDVDQMRDALAHHVNHYKSALKNGKRDIADQHMNKIIPMMHLAGRAAAHSGGKLGLDYTPLEPWETNYTSTERRPETGKLKEGTKGLRRRLNSTPRDKNPRSVPDYRYLEMPSHEEHADSKRSPHKGGYPFEEIQLGSPADVDSKQAYLHSQDVGPQDEYVGHPFDEHPIHGFAEHKEEDVTPQKLAEFEEKMGQWPVSEHNKKWVEGVKQLHASDPEAFASRGKAKPGHHYEGISLLDQPHKKAGAPDISHLPPELAAKFANTQAAPTPQPQAPAPTTQPVATPKLSPEHMANLPPALRAKLGGQS